MKRFIIILSGFLLLIECSEKLEETSSPIKLEFLNSNVEAADGISKISIKVSIKNKEVDSIYRLVRLETDGGTFNKFETDDSDTTLFVSDADTVEIIAGLIAGDYFIKASLINDPNVFNLKSYTLSRVGIGSVLDVSEFPNSLLADNSSDFYSFSFSNYKAKNIKLSVTKGSLGYSNNKDTIITIPEDGNITFRYTSSQDVGDAVLLASLDQTDLKVNVPFSLTRSYPDSLIIIPSSYEIDSAGSITLNVLLSKDQGKVSTGNQVNFSALQDDGTGSMNEVGRFENIPAYSTNEEKVKNITFKLDTRFGNRTEQIEITASCRDQSGNTISDSIFVDVNH